MLPTQTVPMLVWPGAARARGQCWYTTDIAPLLRTQTVPGWEVVIRLAGAVRGQCWDTTDIAPYAPYANSPRQVWPGRRGAARARGWGGDTTAFAPHAPYATNSPRQVWPGRRGRGASAGIQRTLLPCSARKQSPGWEVVLPLGWYGRGGAGLGRVRSGDTTAFAPHAPYANGPRLVGPARARGQCWDTTDIAPLLRMQTVPRLGGGFAAISGWAGAGAARRGASAGIQRTLLPCSLRKQSPG